MTLKKPGVHVGVGIGEMALKNATRPPNASVWAGTPQAMLVFGAALSIHAYIEYSE